MKPSLSRDTSELRSWLRFSVRGGFTTALATTKKKKKQLYQIETKEGRKLQVPDHNLLSLLLLDFKNSATWPLTINSDGVDGLIVFADLQR